MNFSIRRWLADHQIVSVQLLDSAGGIPSIAFHLVQNLETRELILFDVNPVAEILELSCQDAHAEIPVLARLTEGILEILSQKKPLKRAEGTWLAFQIAYLRALEQVLTQEIELRRAWLQRTRFRKVSPEPPLSELINSLHRERLSDADAEQALTGLDSSALVQQMHLATQAWFMANGAEERESQLLTLRLNHSLSGHLLVCVASHALSLPQLQKFVRLGNRASWEEPVPDSDDYELLEAPAPPPPPSLLPIHVQRECYRAQFKIALSVPVFEEYFALPDLYVPLRGIPLEMTASGQSVDLMSWALKQLTDLATIAVIEGAPGQGKTSFCQIWAAKIAADLYPDWMPILIQLADATLGLTLEQTLDSVLPEANFTCADGWLSPVNPPCVLILEGLDELPRSSLAQDHLGLLIDQLIRFQAQYTTATGLPRHKIFLTSRSGILGIETDQRPMMPHVPTLTQFARIAIAPMNQEELKQWFKHWSRLQTKPIAQNYFNFLKSSGMFRPNPPAKELATMVRYPLILYVMGVLYRDRLLDEAIFQMAYPQVKFEIYDRLMTWLLGEPTAGLATAKTVETVVRLGMSHATRTREAIATFLGSTSPQQCRRQMQELAIALWQTGRKRTRWDKITGSYPDLPIFFFQSTAQTVEFSHSSLGDYLTAQQLAMELVSLVEKVRNPYGETVFKIADPHQVATKLYEILGCGLLSQELEEFILERLWREEARDPNRFNFRTLLKRLHYFYQSYCQGRWLDEGITYQARQVLQAKGNALQVLQIDGVVGLNVFVILCAIHREAQIPFAPCGYRKSPLQRLKSDRGHDFAKANSSFSLEPGDSEDDQFESPFNPSQLLVLAGRVGVLSPFAFWQRTRQSLQSLHLLGVNLNRAFLSHANLQHCHLEGATLIEANLVNANLKAANLAWADLRGADLSKANLSGTNLEGANLMGANLSYSHLQSANLTNACLFQTILDDGNLEIVRSKGAFFALEPFLAYRQAMAFQNLKEKQLQSDRGDETSVLPIQMAEDESVTVDDELATAATQVLPDLSDDAVTQDLENEVETIVYHPES